MDEDDRVELSDAPTDDDSETDAIASLMQDHDEIRQVFQDYASLGETGASEQDRRTLVNKLSRLLTVHAALEEEFFYPAARDALEDPELPQAALADHQSMAALLDDLGRMSPADAAYDTRVQSLQELVEQHLEDEENELFPLAGERLADLDDLGDEMQERREELQAEFDEDSSAE